ncbi:MAG TPA: NAD(P)H-quinone oxidoreductase [Pyrinomonadaceae bacterium]|nr:NAD(P)H-quinone oxidoreductase [Pyrinomonadaceae bacterium]
MLMRAVKIVSRDGAGVLELGEAERPRASADRVLVRVRAAGLNRADLLQWRGRYPAPAGVPADIPGLEFAGERVFGITGGGAQAEYVVVPESSLARVPEGLSFAEAAAVPEVFITAHDALFTQAGLRTGERVLVHAAGSGVGTAAVQLIRAAGAVAYGTARTAGKLERARPFGLDASVVVGEDPRAFVEAVRGWTNGAGVDVILDLVGASYLPANLEALAPRGRLMLVGTLGGSRGSFDFGPAMRKRLRVTGTVLRARSTAEKADAVGRFAREVVPLFARGLLRPVLDSTYALADAAAAYERLETNETFGKVVLEVAGDG